MLLQALWKRHQEVAILQTMLLSQAGQLKRQAAEIEQQQAMIDALAQETIKAQVIAQEFARNAGLFAHSNEAAAAMLDRKNQEIANLTARVNALAGILGKDDVERNLFATMSAEAIAEMGKRCLGTPQLGEETFEPRTPSFLLDHLGSSIKQVSFGSEDGASSSSSSNDASGAAFFGTSEPLSPIAKTDSKTPTSKGNKHLGRLRQLIKKTSPPSSRLKCNTHEKKE